MKKLSSFVMGLAGAAFLLALLLTSIFAYATSEEFYAGEYAKLGQAQAIGISDDDLAAVTQGLLEYTTGERETLDMQYPVNGETREIFNQKEKSHMVDVRELYASARSLQIALFIGAAVGLAAGWLICRRGYLRRLATAWLGACGVFLAVVAVLGLWAYFDFSSFWTTFHLVFFTNDLWMLDPATDILIMMVPSQFFSDLVMAIIRLFAILFIVTALACEAVLLVLRRRKRNPKPKSETVNE